MNPLRRMAFVAAALWAVLGDGARAEVIIQYFETRWDEMYQRLPEIAETGYESIWTPPPGKSPIGGPYAHAYGGNVGYNSFDRFDLGDHPQRGNWETRYGSRTSLRSLVDNAHQMDLKIYPDIVFNHTGNGPDFRTYPGMVPQDFHGWNDASQPGGFKRAPRMFIWSEDNGYGGTLHQELVSLMDIVLEFDGRFQGANSPNYAPDPTPFIRHPGDPEKYPYFSTTGYVTEDSRDFVTRWINWLGYAMDYDGVRLDAPKHVGKEYFGLPGQSEATRNRTLIYNIQKNYNERRGLSDTDPFDEMYQNYIRRNDALVYSEFFIGSVNETDYWRNPSDPNWGIKTRYLDFPRKSQMIMSAFNNGNLSALSSMAGFSPEEGVIFAHSHDEDPPWKLELAYAYILTRVGTPVVYFTGNNLADNEDKEENGITWMRKGYDGALGDFGMSSIPNLVYIHNQFARGKEWNRWQENDFFAYERYNDSNNNNSPDAGEGLLLVVLNDSGFSQTRNNVTVSFPPGTRLKDYTGRAADITVYNNSGVSQVNVTVPAGGGQGFVCYAPYNAEGPLSGAPITFTGDGVGTMPWVIPGGRDGTSKSRTMTKLTGNSATINVYYRQPAQGGETVDNVLLKWGQGRNLNASAQDFTGNDVVTGGYEQMTKIADGHYRLVVDLTGVPEGLHTVKARAFNGRAAGRPALFQTFTTTVYVDRRGPDLEFENLNVGETIEGSRVVTVNNPDRTLHSLTYTIDGGPSQQADQVIKGKWRLNLSGLTAGNHSITLNATEADYGTMRSVINTSTLTRNFTVDTAGSSIAINHAANATINEPFFLTTVTVPAGTATNNVKLFWNGYEQIGLAETSAGSGVFQATFDGRYRQGNVDKRFTGPFVNGPNFFEAVVNSGTVNENRISRRVVFNLFGQNLHDSDGDGLPDNIEIENFLSGRNPGPNRPLPGDRNTGVDGVLDNIPNYGETWTRLNPMNDQTFYNGTRDGDSDFDGDGVSNLQEVVRGFRISGNPNQFNIYDRNSVPPATVGSYATAALTGGGGVRYVTITYRPNDGVLSGASAVTVNVTPTGGGPPQSFTMEGGPTEFTYTYTVPSGATSVAFTFSNGGVTDSSGGNSWSAATTASFVMDGLFDSQNFLVSNNGMRIYAAVRGNKLYTATWSPKGGTSDHVLYITDQFGNPVTAGPASASDSAANYTTWANGSNLGSGFDAWALSNAGSSSGVFVGDPASAGIQGMNARSFGLFAKGGAGSSAAANRSFSALNVGDSIAFQWGINWDGGNGADGKKGFNLWAGSTFLMNVENAGSDAINVGGTSSGMGFGTQAMNWSITRTAADKLLVRATRRDGGVFTRELTVSSSAPTRLEFYATNLNGSGSASDNDKRQPYFDDLRIYRSGTSAKSGRVYGAFDGTTNSKPWVFAAPDYVARYGFKASGRSAAGNNGQALESELDLVEAFGAVPQTLFISAVAYSAGFGGTIQSQAPPSFGNSGNDVEIPEYQALNTASLRDEDLDGRFDVGNPEMFVAVGGNETDGNYGLRRFYLDEVAGDTSSLTVKFKPNAAPGASVSNVEVFTNLNRRDLAVLEEDPSTVTTSSDTYFRAYTMTGPDASGYYTATLPVNLCGAYRLQVRYKIAGVNGGNYIYYTDNGLRRDCAIVVSPKKSLQMNMYEVNPLIVEAKDNTKAGRSTFLDLVNDPATPGEAGGYDGRPDALNKDQYAHLGVNMLWLQPIHPIGVEGRDINPETPGLPFDPGSPYAVRDYWSVAPMLGRSDTAENAMSEFQTFVSRLDNWGVSVMMDGTFNHSAPDAIMGQGAVDLAFTNNGAVQIRNYNPGWYAREGYPGQPATGTNNIAVAPDRNDFGNWTDVREFFFGDYDALVKEKGTQNPDKTYPDNAFKLAFLLERDKFEGHTDATRQIWNYFAYYPIYWLEKTGMTAGTPKNMSHVGIDGLRCDFAQGLPSQFWEYAINKTRSRKWDFIFMAESLDGFREVGDSTSESYRRHGVSYRSARHFDVLNENIVFYWRDTFFGYPANGGAGTVKNPITYDTWKAYDDRRDAFENVTLLNNLTSHDEVFPHNDVWAIAYGYAQVGAMDGIPMLMYGQEAGAQNSKTAYGASEGNFGPINASNNFARYEANFGKNIPNFKVYNNMAAIWNNRTADENKLATFYGRVNKARTNAPALQSQNVYFLSTKTTGLYDTNVFAVGKVANLGQPVGASGQSVVFAFVNNNYRGNANVSATFDLNGKAPGTDANYFGIDRGRRYNVKDLLADNAASLVWPTNRTGADLIDNGLFVGLPNTNVATGRYQAQYLQLLDVTAPSAVTGAISNNLANGSHAITNRVTFAWDAVATDSSIVPFYRVNISTNGVAASNAIVNSNSFTYIAPATDTRVDITVRAVNPNDTNSASAATAPYTAYLLTANGDYNGNGTNNATDISNGLNPTDNSAPAAVYINEVQSTNTGLPDQYGQLLDWVELHNPGGSSFDLSGYFLSDNILNKTKYQFPNGTTIAAGGYLVIWCGSATDGPVTGPYNSGQLRTTAFAISSGGEPILVTAPDGTTVIDQFASLVIGTSGSPPVGRSLGRGTSASFDTLYFYTSPTQGTVNNTSGTEAVPISPPSFSAPGGMFTANVSLSLGTTEPGAVVRYTTDGSDPTESSPVYSSPLTLTSSGNTNTAYYNIPTNLRNLGWDENWQPPAEAPFKINVVRARVFKSGRAPSRIVTHSYLVHPSGANRYPYPVVSINTDPVGLFSDATGIYVHGTNSVGPNYLQDGSNWERAGQVEFFETNGTRAFSGDMGLRLHGNTTLSRPRKSLRVYSRDASGAPFQHQIFPQKGITNFSTFLLRNSGNDWSQTMLRDAFMTSLAAHTGVDLQASRPAVVFLDGEYWGIHNLRDRIDEGYYLQHHGLTEAQFTQLDVHYQDAPLRPYWPIYDRGNPDTNMVADYEDILTRAGNNEYASEASYTNVASRIDVDNYIDYNAFQIFSGNSDWPANNTRLWRSVSNNTTPGAPKTHDGRWRWILYDTDMGLGLNFDYVPGWDADVNQHAHVNTLALSTTATQTTFANHPDGTVLLRKLLSNPVFNRKFINRFADLLNTSLAPGRTTNALADIQTIFSPGIAEHVKRWPRTAPWLDWTNEMNRIRTFLQVRPGAVRGHIADEFGLNGTANLTVDVANTNQGTVTVNTISIDPSTVGVSTNPYPWTGTYFQGVPVTVTAVPKPGFRFGSWNITNVSTNVTLASTDTTTGYVSWTNGVNRGTNLGAWELAETASATDGFFVGVGNSTRGILNNSADGRVFGIFAHTGGNASAARPFGFTLSNNQVFSVKLSPGGFTPSSHKGVRFGTSSTNWFTFFASDFGGAPAYYFQRGGTTTRIDGASFSPKMDNTFDVSVTRTDDTNYRVSILRGSQSFITNFTSSNTNVERVSRATFYSYSNASSDDTNNLYFNDLSIKTIGSVATNISSSTNLVQTITPGGPISMSASFAVQGAVRVAIDPATNGVAGSALSISVKAVDIEGNTDGNYTGSFTLTISGPNGYAQTLSSNAVGGVATFSGLLLPQGGSYTLGATSGSLTAESGTSYSVKDGATYLPAGNGVWNAATNWDTGVVPNSTVARVIIPANAATNRTVTNNSPITVAAITFSNGSSAFANTIAGSAGNSLTLQATNTNAVITVTGSGTGNAELNLTGPLVLNSDLVVDVQSTNSINQEYGAMRMRGTNWSGAGGVIKRGPGMAGFTQAGKAIAGNIVIEQGVLTFSEPSISSLLSTNITVQAGGQLRLSSAGTPRTNMFNGPINLAGSGRSGVGTNENLGVLGALRLETGTTGTTSLLTNTVNLTASADIHAPAGNTIQLSGSLTASSNNVILTKSGGGTLTLGTNAGGFTGGITVHRGTLRLAGATFTNTTNAMVLTNDTTLVGSGQWGGALRAGSNSALTFEVGAVPAGTALLRAASATFSGSNTVTLTVPTNAVPGTYPLLSVTGSISGFSNVSLASAATNFAWSQLMLSNNTIFALLSTNVPNLPTAWHNPTAMENLLSPPTTMRSPAYDLSGSTNLTIYAAFRRLNNPGYGTANLSAGQLYYRAATNTGWSAAPLSLHANNGDHQIWKADLPAGSVAAWTEYYIRLAFESGVASPVYIYDGGANSSALTVTEATAQAQPFAVRMATTTLGSLVQAFNGSARAALAVTAPTNLTVNFTYNGSAAAPTNPGVYTVIGTISDPIFQGSVTNNFVITGVLPGNDTVIKTNNTVQHRYSFAELLANDTRVATTGATLTNNSLTIVAVTPGAGSSASIRSSFVFFTPSTNSTDVFTYFVTDGASTNTALVTINLAAPTNVPAPFPLTITRSGVAVFDGTATRITNDFIGVPNQVYAIEYKGELTEPSWTSSGATNTGPTGSFSMPFSKPGDFTSDWNGSMFFRGVRTNQ